MTNHLKEETTFYLVRFQMFLIFEFYDVYALAGASIWIFIEHLN